ncbi:MAG: RNA polymerase sigma factor [Bacteroidales bacterium]|nr:RNA polymerase sigma factor [Bacteroidales bacterium]
MSKTIKTQKKDRVLRNNNDTEERQLINALVAGNESAYRIIIEKYRESVVRLCMGFTGSYDDAQDLAQEVFIEIFNSISKFKRRSSFSTWMYRVAVNKSLNFLRKKKNLVSMEQANETVTPANNNTSAEKNLEISDHARALHTALDRLPGKQRAAFILSKYDDLQYAEIADIMKTSISSVESLLFRAKKNLQQSLLEYYKNNMK